MLALGLLEEGLQPLGQLLDSVQCTKGEPLRLLFVLHESPGDVALDVPQTASSGLSWGVKRVREFQTGDFDVQAMLAGRKLKITAPAVRFTLIQRGDGYVYVA